MACLKYTNTKRTCTNQIQLDQTSSVLSKNKQLKSQQKSFHVPASKSKTHQQRSAVDTWRTPKRKYDTAELKTRPCVKKLKNATFCRPPVNCKDIPTTRIIHQSQSLVSSPTSAKITPNSTKTPKMNPQKELRKHVEAKSKQSNLKFCNTK